VTGRKDTDGYKYFVMEDGCLRGPPGRAVDPYLRGGSSKAMVEKLLEGATQR